MVGSKIQNMFFNVNRATQCHGIALHRLWKFECCVVGYVSIVSCAIPNCFCFFLFYKKIVSAVPTSHIGWLRWSVNTRQMTQILLWTCLHYADLALFPSRSFSYFAGCVSASILYRVDFFCCCLSFVCFRFEIPSYNMRNARTLNDRLDMARPKDVNTTV